jgi:lysophospholipase L1-like esterase
MGNSIFDAWAPLFPVMFPGKPYVGRGISGQTTPQMLVRFRPDVVDLHPAAVVILAGTNDIAGNTGPMTAQMSENNFRAMSDIARRHGIAVLLAPVPPAASFPWSPEIQTRPRIAELNRWLERFARESGATWVDYRRVLDDGTGAMKPGLAVDGVHPTEAGYDAMATVIEPILRRMFGRAHRA